MNRRMKRMALPVGAALILGSSGFAFMAANTGSTSYAGSGTEDIAGYNVSNVDYDFAEGLANSQSQPINAVSFDLNHAADQVDAWILRSAGQGGAVAYDDCTSSDGYSWVCTPSGSTKASVGNAEDLTVSAAQ